LYLESVLTFGSSSCGGIEGLKGGTGVPEYILRYVVVFDLREAAAMSEFFFWERVVTGILIVISSW
jgi:hypothetical protein